jgi:hypothetical protein
MGAVTYPDRNVIEFIRDNFIPLQVPFDGQPLAANFNVKWTPTLVTLGPDGREHHRTVGFLDPAELIASLLLGIGKYHFDHDRFAEAVATFDTMIVDYPASDSVPEALYLSGVSRFKEGHNPTFLKETYEKLEKDYPGNEWTKRASPYRLID